MLIVNFCKALILIPVSNPNIKSKQLIAMASRRLVISTKLGNILMNLVEFILTFQWNSYELYLFISNNPLHKSTIKITRHWPHPHHPPATPRRRIYSSSALQTNSSIHPYLTRGWTPLFTFWPERHFIVLKIKVSKEYLFYDYRLQSSCCKGTILGEVRWASLFDFWRRCWW